MAYTFFKCNRSRALHAHLIYFSFKPTFYRVFVSSGFDVAFNTERSRIMRGIFGLEIQSIFVDSFNMKFQWLSKFMIGDRRLRQPNFITIQSIFETESDVMSVALLQAEAHVNEIILPALPESWLMWRSRIQVYRARRRPVRRAGGRPHERHGDVVTPGLLQDARGSE